MSTWRIVRAMGVSRGRWLFRCWRSRKFAWFRRFCSLTCHDGRYRLHSYSAILYCVTRTPILVRLRNCMMPLRSRWPNVSYLILLVLALSAACDSSGVTGPVNQQDGTLQPPSDMGPKTQYEGDTYENPYEWVGRVHNQGLAYTLDELEAYAESHGTVAPARVRAYAARHLRNYLRSRLSGTRAERRAIRWGFERAPALSVLTDRAGFSDQQKEYLRRVREVTNWGEYGGSIEPLLRDLRELERAAVETLGEEKATPVLLASAVSAHSVDYWNSYSTRHRWKEVGYSLFGTRRPGAVTLDDDVAAADVAGAIGGAAGSLVTGCGELSLGACVAAAAAAGATAASIEEFITHVL